MDKPEKPDTTTGSGTPKTILAGDTAPTAGPSRPAPARSGSASITPVDLLSLLQSDLADLQSRDLQVILTGTQNGRLGILIDWPGHKLDVREGGILADGKKV